MPLATLDNLHLSFGQRVMFDGLSFTIDRGERVGLIGDNGAGKSTLFRVIEGTQKVDAGSASVPRGTKVGYLKQDPKFDENETVIDQAELAFAELHDISHKLRELEHDMAEHQGDDLDKTLLKYEKLQHEFDLKGGYAWRHKLEATLLGVGLPTDVWEAKCGKLSGGQRSRLALAQVLISEPDLLLLDEPTNHLDLEAIAWLEEWLLDFDGAVWLISHDRYLLDRLATRIVWLNRAVLRSYPGNYSSFVQQRELAELTQAREYEKQQAYIEKQKEFIRRFNAGQRAQEAQGREKKLNRLLKSDAMVDAVQHNKAIHLRMNTDQRAGDQVLRVRELTKGFDGRALWQNIEFDVKRGERIGIIGPNGSGKTTLLRTLLGEMDSDDGDIRWGANLAIGYYDQRLDDFNPDNTVIEEVADGRPEYKEPQLRDILATMLFRGDDIYKHMGVLSGGERARVALIELLLDKPNVLLLDEPTNHLDVASAEALEKALNNFPGTILCVSHDRYFLQKTVSRLLVLQPPEVIDFEGRFNEWTEKLKQQKQAERDAKAEAKSAANKAKQTAAQPKPQPKVEAPKPRPQQNQPKKPADNPYKRPFGRHTVQQLEAEIAETEIELNDLRERCADPKLTRDPGQSKRVRAELEAAEKKLKQLEEEYYARETA
jgi:ATP-binding cassette subfamily F protein 3